MRNIKHWIIQLEGDQPNKVSLSFSYLTPDGELHEQLPIEGTLEPEGDYYTVALLFPIIEDGETVTSATIAYDGYGGPAEMSPVIGIVPVGLTDVVWDFINNGVSFIAGAPPPPPPPDEGRLSPCPPLGDVDGDGFITIEDVKLIGEYLVGRQTLTEDQLARARVFNGEGPLTRDALLIFRFVGGALDTFPMCGMEPPPDGEPPPPPPPPPPDGTGSDWGLLIGLGIAAYILSKGGK